MTITDAIKFMVAMIIMLNPLGAISIFLQLTKGSTKHRQIAKTTTVAIIIIMLITLWSGEQLLNFLGISIPSFRFAGGIILLLMGLAMLQSRESPVSHTSEDDKAAKERESIAVVPMALPVIVGPGAISTLIIATGDYQGMLDRLSLSLICIFLGIAVGAMLYFATSIFKLVGESVIKVVTRIMGMIIMAIAVGMLADGLIGLLPALH